MEAAAAISEADQDLVHTQAGSEQESGVLELSPALLEIKRIGIFNEIDKQLQVLSQAACALIDTQANPVVTNLKEHLQTRSRLRSPMTMEAGRRTSFAADEAFGSLP